MANYGILGWIVIGLLAGADRQAADAGHAIRAAASSPSCSASPARSLAGSLGHCSAGTRTARRGLRRRDRRRVPHPADLSADCHPPPAELSRSPPFREQPWRPRKAASGDLNERIDPMKQPFLLRWRWAPRPFPPRPPPRYGDLRPADRRYQLDISATGEVTRVPDLATISAGVVTRSATATAAHPAECRSHGAGPRGPQARRHRRPRHPDLATSASTPNIATRTTSRRS